MFKAVSKFLKESEKKIIEKIVAILLTTILLFIFSSIFYQFYFLYNIQKTLPVKHTVGTIKNISRLNTSYSLFEVNDVIFRSESLAGSCIDVRGQLEDDRKVDIKYVYVNQWPTAKRGFGCIIEIVYLSPKLNIKTGQASRRI